jgi:hypothetical protein
LRRQKTSSGYAAPADANVLDRSCALANAARSRPSFAAGTGSSENARTLRRRSISFASRSRARSSGTSGPEYWSAARAGGAAACSSIRCRNRRIVTALSFEFSQKRSYSSAE